MKRLRFDVGASLGALLGVLAYFGISLATDPGLVSAPYYDELRDASGRLRPQYEAIYPIYEAMSEAQRAAFRAGSLRDFRGDNTLSALPRLLTRDEYAEIERGVKQRGTALRMFLQDHYSGRKTYRGVIPEAVLERILERAGEAGLEGRVRPEQIAFPYGPDIIRAADGSWRVIEDNPGFIGGPGDLKIARESLLKNQPKYAGALDPRPGRVNDPVEYYREIVKRARERAVPRDGEIVMYAVPPYPDNEDQRLKKLFSELGVRVITPHTNDGLVVREDGVYIRARDNIAAKPLERVGYLILNGEYKWIDPTDPEMRKSLAVWFGRELLGEKSLAPESRRQIEAALGTSGNPVDIDYVALERALSRSNFVNDVPLLVRMAPKGLFQAIVSGKVAANYAPGVDFIGDKEFYLYVEDLIRHYLHEEPVLKNLSTRRFGTVRTDGTFQLDEKFLREFFDSGEYRTHVVKVVDGRGGDGIYIGPKLDAAQVPAIIERVRARPEAFIIQPYSHLSVLGDSIVDLRAIADVSPRDVFVSKTPWSRGVPMSGDGKVNLSANGHEYAVIVVDGLSPRAQCFSEILSAERGE